MYGDSDTYNQLLQPAAGGTLFFAGEAASACHGYVDSRHSLECASEPNLINSWVAGGLDSAWRAVDQYLKLHKDKLPKGIRKIFHEKWGSTEYMDEVPHHRLGKKNRELMKRHLVIALYNSGIRMPKTELPEL